MSNQDLDHEMQAARIEAEEIIIEHLSLKIWECEDENPKLKHCLEESLKYHEARLKQLKEQAP